MITNLDEFVAISESLQYHVSNGINIVSNIYRHGSSAYIGCIEETRSLMEDGSIILDGVDKELYESTDIGRFGTFRGVRVPLDLPFDSSITESEYKGKEVKLGKPMRGGVKKYYVYVKDGDRVKKISFGDNHGGLTAKVSNPEARKSFAARHQCHLKKDRTTAGYWSCRINRYAHLWNGNTYPGYW